MIEARARERLERERAEYEAKLEARAEKAEKTGRKPGGRPPEPPVAGPGPKDQVNLTDADSRIMPVAGGGFEQAYNAQALVAADSLLVVTNDVVQAPNDKRQIEPALEALARLPEALGAPETLLADSGYFSEANVNACAEAEIAPLITPGRERHHLSWKDRFAGAPPPPENPTPLEAMTHRLATPEGRQLYALRKQTPEPVFRHHQIGHGLPPVLATRPGQGHGRMEPGDPGLEHKENVSPCNTLEQAAGLRTSRKGIRVCSPCGTREQANVLRALTRGHKSILTLRYARPSDRTPWSSRKALDPMTSPTSRSVHTHSRGTSVRQAARLSNHSRMSPATSLLPTNRHINRFATVEKRRCQMTASGHEETIVTVPPNVGFPPDIGRRDGTT